MTELPDEGVASSEPEPGIHYSPESFLQEEKLVQIGDLTFLPGLRVPGNTIPWFGRNSLEEENWFQISCATRGRDPRVWAFDARLAGIALQDAYDEFCQAHTTQGSAQPNEPGWLEHCAPGMRAELRRHIVFADWYQTLITSAPIMPGSARKEKLLGFTYTIGSDGLLAQATDALGLYRLNRVSQLSYLQPPSYGQESLTQTFGHKRFYHSADVSATKLSHSC